MVAVFDYTHIYPLKNPTWGIHCVPPSSSSIISMLTIPTSPQRTWLKTPLSYVQNTTPRNRSRSSSRGSISAHILWQQRTSPSQKYSLCASRTASSPIWGSIRDIFRHGKCAITQQIPETLFSNFYQGTSRPQGYPIYRVPSQLRSQQHGRD